MPERFTFDYGRITPARGRVGRAGVDAAARIHRHGVADTDTLQDTLDGLAAADAALEAGIDALADRMLVHEDGEVLTGSGMVLIAEAG